jgi:predicted AAA+ superfamily ATPase
MKRIKSNEWSQLIRFDPSPYGDIQEIRQSVERSSILIFGPRKCGKNTLAKGFLRTFKQHPYLNTCLESTCSM